MTDYRIGLDLFSDVLAVLHRHGFARGDDLHAGRAIFLIGDMARIYDGSQDHSNEFSTSQSPEPPGPRTVRPRGRPERRNAHPRGVRTVRTVLDLAANWKRGRAERCT